MIIDKFYTRCVRRGCCYLDLDLISSGNLKRSYSQVKIRGFSRIDRQGIHVFRTFGLGVDAQLRRLGSPRPSRKDWTIPCHVHGKITGDRDRRRKRDLLDEDGFVRSLFVHHLEFSSRKKICHRHAQILRTGQILRLAHHRKGLSGEVGLVGIAYLRLRSGESEVDLVRRCVLLLVRIDGIPVVRGGKLLDRSLEHIAVAIEAEPGRPEG